MRAGNRYCDCELLAVTEYFRYASIIVTRLCNGTHEPG